MSVLLAPELLARVRQIRIRTHRLVNTALSGGYRSTFRGSGLEFSDVRAYQPGDEVRRIDWNVTTRAEAFVRPGGAAGDQPDRRHEPVHELAGIGRSADATVLRADLLHRDAHRTASAWCSSKARCTTRGEERPASASSR
jgi:hypothetical protein